MNYVLLGGGSVTAEYYLPALAILGNAGRITVVDSNETSLAPLRAAFPTTRFLNQDHDSFLNGSTAAVDQGIIVALPNHLHVEAARSALDAGHHVLCEKPLSLKAGDCLDLRTQSQRTGKILKVAMSRRYLPSLMLARDMVLAQELGPVRSVEVQDCAPFLWRPKSFAFFAPEAGGILADMGVHYLDYLDTVIGELEPVLYSDDSRGGNEASLSYELRAGAVPVSMHLSRLDPAGAFMRFACERGDILIEKQNEREVFVTPARGPARRVMLDKPFADPKWPMDFRGSFCAMLSDFEQTAQGKHTGMTDAADAQRTAALIEWAYSTRDMQHPRMRRTAPTSRPDVLVTGATGFIGGHLIDRLAGQGDRIRAAVRSPASCANIARYELEIAPVDLLKREELENAVSGTRRIFHLAYGRGGPDAASVTIEGTKNLVEAAINGGVECVVILSTMYVFGFPAGPIPADESFPYRPYGGEYGLSKAKMERWCLERAKDSGNTRIVVLNPTCVFGPGGVAYTKLPVELARQGQFCWIDDGKGICNFTYVESVVDAMLAAATLEKAHGQRFIINDGSMSWREFLGPFTAPLQVEVPSYSVEAFKALPRSGPIFRLKDLAAAVLAAREVRDVAKRSRLVRKVLASLGEDRRARLSDASRFVPLPSTAGATQKPLPPDWLLDLYHPATSVFSAEKAKQVLKWSPFLPYEAARDKTIRWLVDAGYYAPRAA